jgi:hypothetical protein
MRFWVVVLCSILAEFQHFSETAFNTNTAWHNDPEDCGYISFELIFLK